MTRHNYRPISVLSSLSKVFERVIFNQIHEYFNLHNLYYGNQYGFRTGHSTELAILEVIDRVRLSLDIGVTPINIYLDLSKAFDTLNHDILLQKLKHWNTWHIIRLVIYLDVNSMLTIMTLSQIRKTSQLEFHKAQY